MITPLIIIIDKNAVYNYHQCISRLVACVLSYYKKFDLNYEHLLINVMKIIELSTLFCCCSGGYNLYHYYYYEIEINNKVHRVCGIVRV